jgi:hypothetical protein
VAELPEPGPFGGRFEGLAPEGERAALPRALPVDGAAVVPEDAVAVRLEGQDGLAALVTRHELPPKPSLPHVEKARESRDPERGHVDDARLGSATAVVALMAGEPESARVPGLVSRPIHGSDYNPASVLDRVKGLERPGLTILLLSALFGASSKIDEFLRLFLRQDSGEAFFPAFSRNFDFFGLVLLMAGAAAAGVALALAGAFLAARVRGVPVAHAFAALSRAWAALLVPVGLTALALLSVSLSPSYPYGLGLALSLDLEGGFASILTAALFASSLVHALTSIPRDAGAEAPIDHTTPRFRRWSRPLVFGLALVLFTLATPEELYRRGAGQGNMFKYLRMAQALAGSGSLDIEKADDNPDASPGQFLSRLPGMARRYADETRVLVSKLAASASEGHLYLGEMTARSANRSMFRSADGGIYYINAPGPGILLVPAHLLDSVLNRVFGWNRQLAVIFLWQLLGALLVCEIAIAGAEVADSEAATFVALVVALIVPLLFYSFQIYPELPAALFLLHAFRKLVLDPLPSRLGVLGAGLALAALPWLHQKYSVVAFALALYGASRFVRSERKGAIRLEPGKLALLALPLLFSAFSVFLYNHALTGSLSPTATFQAAGRSSFEPHAFLKGLLGLLFDRENGLFVFAPLYLLALVGLPALARRQSRLLKPFALVVFSYLFVISSFPYWPGAVSTMGRYILSVLPLLALPLSFSIARARRDGVVAGVAAVLLAGSLAVSWSFVQDLVPSYQPMLLWERALYCDPVLYLPSFLSEGFLGSGPGHYPKLLAELLVALVLVYWLGGRVAREERVDGDQRFASGAALGAGAFLAGIVVLAGVLEHFPGNRTEKEKPVFRDTRVLDSGLEVSVDGEHGFEGEGVWVPGGGETRFLVLSRRSLHTLDLELRNGPAENRVEVVERGGNEAAFDLPALGPHARTIFLRRPLRFDGPKGERFLYLFTVHSRGFFVPADSDSRNDDRRKLGTYVRVR